MENDLKSTGNISQWRILLLLMFITGITFAAEPGRADKFDIIGVERPRILKKAVIYLRQGPRTVTADKCQRNAAHDDNLSGDDSRIIMDRVVPFVRKQVAESNPFFAYVCFHTPHTPTVSGGKFLEMYKDHEGRHHYGAITAMDAQIGRLRNLLRELGQEENTLIWFCSDNGAMSHIDKHGLYGGYGSNLPFRGWKSSFYEGGIRVPSVLVYPAMFKEPEMFIVYDGDGGCVGHRGISRQTRRIYFRC